MLKTIVLSVVAFFAFAFISVIGPFQEVEVAHCILSGLLGVVIVLVSTAIQKLNKVIALLTSDKKNDK